jgi:hypothetical protein
VLGSWCCGAKITVLGFQLTFLMPVSLLEKSFWCCPASVVPKLCLVKVCSSVVCASSEERLRAADDDEALRVVKLSLFEGVSEVADSEAWLIVPYLLLVSV